MIQGEKLKVNGLRRPDSLTPGSVMFSWIPVGAKGQTAYRICIEEKGQKVYDSGKICSKSFNHSPDYLAGGNISAKWQLTLWDENDVEGVSRTDTFETVPEPDMWEAAWITPEDVRPYLECIPIPGEENNPNPAARIRKVEHRNPASCLRKKFRWERGKNRVRLYATAHGIYDIWVNGMHVDGWLLAPGTSQYDKRLMVQGYDVTDLLCVGENTVFVSLGDGWYRGSVGNSMDINTFGDDIAFLCQMMTENSIILMTDDTWEACNDFALGRNDMMRGEEFDARKQDLVWRPVKVLECGYENIIGSDIQPIRPMEYFMPEIIYTPAGEVVLDFGQNFAGYVELHLTDRNLFGALPEGGERILMTHGEMLDENGNFTIDNFQNPAKPECFQQVSYICKAGENHYRPTKCYFGFRYVKVETEISITKDMFTGVAVYSDMDTTASFSCGKEEVNQLFQNTLRSMKSNFVGVPTDCPTREKSGFSGDAQVFCHTALYLMDSAPVFRQWLKEFAAAALPGGGLRQVAPDHRAPGFFEKSAGWCDAMEIIPWKIWQRYNLLTIPEEEYDAMKSWLFFCINRAKETRPENADRIEEELLPYFADMGFCWGEWLEPGSDSGKDTVKHMMHGEPEAATAYLSYGCSLMAQMAHALGKEEDAAYFGQVSEKAGRAYRAAFLSGKEIRSKRQCLYVRPLAFGLFLPQERNAAAMALTESIRENGNRLNTGFLSTGELCRVLTDYGQAETAYDLLLQEECPGWLYPVKKGATTIWERWDGIGADGTVKDSLNHYAYGAVAGWLMDRVCGICVEWGKIRIRPYPDRRLGYARGEYLSPLGKIVSAWKYSGEKLVIEIEIPCGGKAEAELPDGEKKQLTGGKYSFEIQGVL